MRELSEAVFIPEEGMLHHGCFLDLVSKVFVVFQAFACSESYLIFLCACFDFCCRLFAILQDLQRKVHDLERRCDGSKLGLRSCGVGAPGLRLLGAGKP